MIMTKQKTLETLEKARLSHLTQMNKIDSVLHNIKIARPTAVAQTECACGQWLYSTDIHIASLVGEQFYHKLESLHSQWHKQYFKIYQICFTDEKKGFFSKLLGSEDIDPMSIDKAKLYYAELQEITDELLKVLAMSKRRLEALNEAKFG